MTIIFPEQAFTEAELELADSEPPGLFPENQDSYWGTFRKVIADYVQTNIMDVLLAWYLNLDPRTVDGNDIKNWEYALGVPSPTGRTLADRRKVVSSRLSYGPFTRTARDNIVKTYVEFTSGGAPTSLTPAGVPITASGVTMFPEESIGATYSIVEDVSAFSYAVLIDGPLGFLPDVVSLARDLLRITPAGISFSITTTPVGAGTFGSGNFGSGNFGG